jgi:hypothetical protein
MSFNFLENNITLKIGIIFLIFFNIVISIYLYGKNLKEHTRKEIEEKNKKKQDTMKIINHVSISIMLLIVIMLVFTMNDKLQGFDHVFIILCSVLVGINSSIIYISNHSLNIINLIFCCLLLLIITVNFDFFRKMIGDNAMNAAKLKQYLNKQMPKKVWPINKQNKKYKMETQEHMNRVQLQNSPFPQYQQEHMNRVHLRNNKKQLDNEEMQTPFLQYQQEHMNRVQLRNNKKRQLFQKYRNLEEMNTRKPIFPPPVFKKTAPLPVWRKTAPLPVFKKTAPPPVWRKTAPPVWRNTTTPVVRNTTQKLQQKSMPLMPKKPYPIYNYKPKENIFKEHKTKKPTKPTKPTKKIIKPLYEIHPNNPSTIPTPLSYYQKFLKNYKL